MCGVGGSQLIDAERPKFVVFVGSETGGREFKIPLQELMFETIDGHGGVILVKVGRTGDGVVFIEDESFICRSVTFRCDFFDWL